MILKKCACKTTPNTFRFMQKKSSNIPDNIDLLKYKYGEYMANSKEINEIPSKQFKSIFTTTKSKKKKMLKHFFKAQLS